jgi:oxepin-CoA hydrolase/3-oxo-5,6-dehydrosuberyl-CoA semialdehyde dehydrogenase
MLTQLKNYAEGKWVNGKKDGEVLHNAVTGAEIYTASSDGLDFGAMMHYARKVGGPALRKLTFHERGRMLKALAFYLLERKEYFYTISALTGATRADSWVDIEGGIGNLFANASLRRQFPDERFYVEGDTAKLSKNNTFAGTHIMVPREGVADTYQCLQFSSLGYVGENSR